MRDKKGNKVAGGTLFQEFRIIIEDIQKNKNIIIPNYLNTGNG